MPLVKLPFKPGINKEGTAYDNEGGWFDGNLVRFNKGRPQKIGGWRKTNLNSFLGTCRALHSWTALDGGKFLGLGTTNKYYIEAGSGASYSDITPIRATTTNGITFAATNGSSVITATDSDHNAETGDFVTISGAASLGGLVTAAVLNQEYEVTAAPSVNTYTFTAKDTSGNTVTANSSDTGNGGSGVDGAYQIDVGTDTYITGTGWSVGTWGRGTFGSASAISSSGQLRIWTHDNFGEDLIINVRGGGIYYWTEANGTNTRAVELSSFSGANQVPTRGLQVLVSEKDRHVIVLGADPLSGSSRSSAVDPMLIAFSDQENPLDFEPLTTNTAGSLRLSEGSSIIGGKKSREEVLVWTDTALYSMQFIGPPFTFGINLINSDAGLAGPNAAVDSASGIFWMGRKSFYVYNGVVQKVPCSVQTYVFDDFNESQVFKVFGFSNTRFDEVGWFYCSSNSLEIDRYVVYDYADQTWTYGELGRTAWLDQGVEGYPRATADNYQYEHEFGYNDDGSPMTNVFLESSDLDLGDGDNFNYCKHNCCV